MSEKFREVKLINQKQLYLIINIFLKTEYEKSELDFKRSFFQLKNLESDLIIIRCNQ